MDDEFDDAPDFSVFLGSESASAKPTGRPPSSAKPTQPTPVNIQQPKPQALPPRPGPSSILVSPRQKGNPILNHIRLLPWEHADIPADYVLGNTTCALFLSLKYHRLHPEYIYSRIKLLAGKYNLRILLTMVDIPNHEDSLKELSKTSLVNNLTLILCWSAPEAAHYLELFKSSENAQPTAIRTQQALSYSDSVVEFIAAPRSINKSDAASIMSTFGSLQAAVNARPEQISQVPGWGEKKVQQWTNAVKEEFRTRNAAGRGASQLPRGNNSPATASIPKKRLLEQDSEDEQTEVLKEVFGVDVPQNAASSSTQEQLGPGVMAALAKLRENE